jgi:putative peptidoglycan lipid II flippase
MVFTLYWQLPELAIWLAWDMMERVAWLALLIFAGGTVYLLTALILGVRFRDLSPAQ